MNDPCKLNYKITLQTPKSSTCKDNISNLIIAYKKNYIINISQFLKQLRLAIEHNERLASDFYKKLTLNIKSTVWQKMGL